MQHVTQANAPTTRSRRRRRAAACKPCRQRKIRCNRNQPCDQCLKSGNLDCTFDTAHSVATATRQRNHVPSRPSPNTNTTSRVTGQDQSSANVTGQQRDTRDGVDAASDRRGCPQQSIDALGEGLRINFSLSKTRYFGPSHWMNTVALFPTELSALHRSRLQQDALAQILNKCMTLGRMVEEKRTCPIASVDLGRNIPPKGLSDRLVANYLRTFEGVLRIVHIPTFQAEYEHYWEDPAKAEQGFIMVLQLCMALGTVAETNAVDMRKSSLSWIYEAQLWLIMPPEKRLMTLRGIQAMCLLTLAKSTCGAGSDATCSITGSLMQTALAIGLHYDPGHLGSMSIYEAELRRRLWATILELNLQCSLDTGGCPVLSGMDYNTLPPRNVDDEMLTDVLDDRCASGEQADVFTETSVQIALLKSLPLRLRLLKHINSIPPLHSYEVTLQLNSKLAQECRSFMQAVSSFSQRPRPIRQFHVSLSQVFLYRCFHGLHLQVISRSFDDPRYYFSRKMCFESAMRIINILGICEVTGERIVASDASALDFQRVALNSTGILRSLGVQSALIIALELTHDRESHLTSLLPLHSEHRSGLYEILNCARAWLIRRINAGETTVMTHCFLSLCIGHIDSLVGEMGERERHDFILRKATETAGCYLECLLEVARIEGVYGAAYDMVEDLLFVDGAADTEADLIDLA